MGKTTLNGKKVIVDNDWAAVAVAVEATELMQPLLVVYSIDVLARMWTVQ